ncbi:hypothetical protein CH296_00560 [Rhodococcus sp. 14-2496-1d]|uniref:helix-turn-helix domain-containing protein n=1 Tax=Rhodococcus sp. 14-2496-1d TaxID=2023146 RepID=UPI000B9B43CE|nr:helix-turn-helix transcriptional regulator [Rhodococcus sp. 14-2496-1d]OZF40782.1 hypothetical protein CH296_00560 [Rhodococcus sp. 14-2496-1d]
MTTELKPRRGKVEATTPFEECDWERVGLTLRYLRETRGYKPDEFASAIGISRPYLANIEAGRKKLTNVLLAKAAKALEIEQLAIMRPRRESAGTTSIPA